MNPRGAAATKLARSRRAMLAVSRGGYVPSHASSVSSPAAARSGMVASQACASFRATSSDARSGARKSEIE